MGFSIAYWHFDEIAYIKYNHISIPSAINSMNKASEQIRKQGLPSPIIYTTTAGNPETRPGQYALKILQSATPFTESMYDLQNRDALVDLINRTSENKMLYLEFSYKQLGKTDEWLRQIIARGQASPDDVARDLLNIWQASNDKAVIPQNILQNIRASKREPDFVDLRDGFVVKWYLPRYQVETESFKATPMIMGMDTSENVSRDYTTFVIIDPRDMKVIATCRCNENNTMQVAQHVFVLLRRFSNLLWIPERNNTGIGIIDFVIQKLVENNINPYTRIYNEVVQNGDDSKYRNINIYDFMTIEGKVRSAFGFRTTGGTASSSRNLLYKVTMMKTLEMNSDRIYDSSLITEFCNLTERNGRIDHPEGCHDDTCIAYLLACYLVFFGKHLNTYNIPVSTILERITPAGKQIDPRQREEQLYLRNRIQDLRNRIDSTSSHMLKEQYDRELRSLLPRVDDSILEVQPLAVSQMEYQEKTLLGKSNGATVESVQNFLNRWRRI